MKKRILSLLLSVIFIIGAIPVISIPAAAENGNTFTISSADDWYRFISSDKYYNANVELLADINVGNQRYYTDTFSGTFNGNNHTITINIDVSQSGVGVFSKIEGATVKNLCVKGYIKGRGPVGGISGVCYDSAVINCINYADIVCSDTGAYSRAGGITAVNEGGRIINCENFGQVKGDKEIGGIVGYVMFGEIYNCYSAGEIVPVTKGSTRAGNIYGSCYYCDNDVRKNYYLSSLPVNNGYVEESSPEVIAWSVSDGVTAFNNNVKAIGTELSDWILYQNKPYLVSFVKAHPVTIGSVAEYNDFANRVNNGQIEYQLADVTLTADIGSESQKITTVIGNEKNRFFGTFNGDFHTVTLSVNGQNNTGLFGYTENAGIKNVVVNGTVTGGENVGGIVGFGLNTKIYNCCNSAYIKATGNYYAGGIIGDADASVIENCLNKGGIEGKNNSVGGIAGQITNGGTVSGCVNEAEVRNDNYNIGGIVGAEGYDGNNVVMNCANYGSVTNNSGSHIGGIVGGLHGTSKVCNSVNFGSIIGGYYQTGVGGIAGYVMGNCSVIACFNSGYVQTGSEHGAVTGTALNGSIYDLNCYKYISGSASGGITAKQLPDSNALELTSVSYNEYISQNPGKTKGWKYWGEYYVNNDYAPMLDSNNTCKHSTECHEVVYASEKTYGGKEYYTCTRCGLSFADGKGKIHIGNIDRLSLWRVSDGRIEKGVFHYTDYENGSYILKQISSGYTLLANSDSQLSGGWYVVSGNIELDSLTVKQNQTVRLIITDNSTLNVKGGVYILGGAYLYVYGQSTGAKAGIFNASSDRHTAGIGAFSESGYYDTDLGGGTLVVNGAHIVARGGDDCAGISGTYNNVTGKNHWLAGVVINGGKVEAYGGRHGAGIGGGAYGDGENITINGGTVLAQAGGAYSTSESFGAAGIGGAFGGRAKNVTINGGTVYAYATGQSDRYDSSKNRNDGIGGAYGAGNSEKIKINGGVVVARGAVSGSAIASNAVTIAGNYNIWSGDNLKSAALSNAYTGKIYVRLVYKVREGVNVRYVRGDEQSSTVRESLSLEAGALLPEPECVSVGMVGYDEWYYDPEYYERIVFGEAFATTSSVYYGKPHDHALVDVAGKEPVEGTHGYMTAYKCRECGCYFEESNCQYLIGNENNYNEWKTGRGISVCYYDADQNGNVVLRKTNFRLDLFDEMTFEWGKANTETWYYVNKDTTVYTRAEVRGSVHIILNDGCTLTDDRGITLEGNNTLIIHSCSLGDNMGTLKASATGYAAGIGGNQQGSSAGDLVINGGNVIATGYIPSDMQGRGGAGIGAAFNGKCGSITVNAGYVEATGGLFAAGIGGAYKSNGGSVTINGGKIIANATLYAAGIGGGMFSDGKFTIRINGGSVISEGGGTGSALGCGDSLSDKTEYNITVNNSLGFIAGNDMANMRSAKITAGTQFTERYAVISDGSEVYSVKVYDDMSNLCGIIRVPYGYPLDIEKINALKFGYVAWLCCRDEYFSEEWNFDTDRITSDTDIYVIWDFDDTQYFSGGDGSEEDPYIIGNEQDLSTVQRFVNDGVSFRDLYFILTIDINTPLTEPIGNGTTPFEGYFDGDGHTVKLDIQGENQAGLFGAAQNAEIRNLTVSGSVSATGNAAGGIIGWAGNNTVVLNCINCADITAKKYIGGIIGDTVEDTSAYILIANCINYGNITALAGGENAGGIAGHMSRCGTVKNCFTAGTVSNAKDSGVVIGWANYNFSLENCYYLILDANKGMEAVRNKNGQFPTIDVKTVKDADMIASLNAYIENNEGTDGWYNWYIKDSKAWLTAEDISPADSASKVASVFAYGMTYFIILSIIACVAIAIAVPLSKKKRNSAANQSR